MNSTRTALRISALLGSGLLAACSLLFESTREPGAEGDAANPELDAATASLSASFTLLPLPCGETRIAPTNVEVIVDQGAPAVALYRWSLRDPEGSELFEVLGAPDDSLERAARVLGGSYGAPEFNLTLYRGDRIGVFDRIPGTETPSLLQQFPVTEGDYELEAVLLVPESRSIEAHLRQNGVGGLNYSAPVDFKCAGTGATCASLFYQKFLFSTNGNLNGTATNSSIQLVFYGVGTFYLDGIRLRSIPDGADLIVNGSFDDLTAWTVGNGVTGEFHTEEIPPSLLAYGEYSLSLSAIDEEGLEGPTTSKTIEHAGCD